MGAFWYVVLHSCLAKSRQFRAYSWLLRKSYIYRLKIYVVYTIKKYDIQVFITNTEMY